MSVGIRRSQSDGGARWGVATDLPVQTAVVEGEFVEVGGVGTAPLQMYVSGENLPEGAERALVPVREPSIEDVLEAFRGWMRLDVADGNPSPETVRSYFSDVKQHLGWLAGLGVRPAGAGAEELKGYRAWLVERYAVSTVGRKLASVRRFYEMAQARGVIGGNPAKGLRSPRDNTKREDKIKYLTWRELQRVYACIDTNTAKGIRDKAIIALMNAHSLRVIAVHRLDLEDLDLEDGKCGMMEVRSKGNKERVRPLTEKTREILKMWLAARQLMRSNDPAVFLTMHWSQGGEPGRISTRGIRQIVDGYLRAAGVKRPGISCHALRHSFAMHALDRGRELIDISDAMGHAQITTTQIYVKRLRKENFNPAEVFDELL